VGTWGSWTLGDAVTFIAVFVGIRIIVIYLATKLFFAMIPDGQQCPICDGATLPVERTGLWRLPGGRYRRSWCIDCGWEGLLRRTVLPVFGISQADGVAMANNDSHSGQLPLISKKSSK
jgi:hypothetical protein